MDAVSLILPMLFYVVLQAVPLALIVKRTGNSRWWLLFALVPILGLCVMMWILAFIKWPMQNRNLSGVFQ